MKKVTLKCEIITPMFMGGCEKIEENNRILLPAELRPSAFKGMIRYWWRAAKGENDINLLNSLESSIFGGSSEDGRRSNVQIRIKNKELNTGEDIKSIINNYNGIKYLYYSTFTLKDKDTKIPIVKKFFKPGSKFDLELVLFNDKDKEIMSSIWLSIFLGGFGARSRRGGGSINVNKVFVDSNEIKDGKINNLSFLTNGINKDNIKEWFEKNISEIKRVINPSGGNSNYNNLVNSSIYIFNKSFTRWEEALEYVGKKFNSFRNSNKSRIFETASFGMPVSHSRFTIRLVPYSNGRWISDRFGSPVIIKICKCGNNFHPIIIKMSGVNLQVGKEVRERSSERANNNIKPIDYKILDEFINTIKNEIIQVKY